MSNIVVNGFKTHIKNPQDPANILRLQLKYERALFKKLKDIEDVIKYAIVKNDVFGLEQQITAMQLTPPPFRAFNFETDTKKVQAFIEWLNELIDEDLLRLGVMAE